MTLFYFLIGLGILILIHELGHFVVAKLTGVKVEKFSIGFGPTIVKFTRGGTEYRISPILLGGYVLPKGDDPTSEAAKDPDSFWGAGPLTRIKIALAGPIFNLVLPLILFPLVFMIGQMEPKFLDEPAVVSEVSSGLGDVFMPGDKIVGLDGKSISTWGELILGLQNSTINGDMAKVEFVRDGGTISKSVPVERLLSVDKKIFGSTVVHTVVNGKPAALAGLKAGDKIKAVNGVDLASYNQMIYIITRSEGKPLALEVERGEQILQMTVMPIKNGDRWWIGFGGYTLFPDDVLVMTRYGFSDSIKKGLSMYMFQVKMTFMVLKGLFSGSLSISNLGGPIQIAKATGDAARSGVGAFLGFLGFLSIQLGILNLLPIPVLDGGHIIFNLIQIVRRKPLSIKVLTVVNSVGLAFIVGLMLYVTFNDINSVWGFQKILGFFK